MPESKKKAVSMILIAQPLSLPGLPSVSGLIDTLRQGVLPNYRTGINI